jgi:inorganic pyrophosphatase
MLKMTDESGPDAKILAVPVDSLSTRYHHIQSKDNLSQQLLKQLSHFFEHYKDLEDDKWVKVEGWLPIEDAKKEIDDSIQSFKDTPVKPHF